MLRKIKKYIEKISLSLFMLAYVLLLCGFVILMVWGMIAHRMEISQKASDYVVTTGVVQAVEKHWIKVDPPGAGEYMDLEYTAKVACQDPNGADLVFESKRSDKKYRVGKKVKVAYDPNDMSTIDIAYFDILTWSYIPRYMNVFGIGWIVVVGGTALTAIAVVYEFIVERRNERQNPKAEEEKPLTKQQLCTRKGGSLMCFLIALFVGFFIHSAGIRKLDAETTYTVEATVVDILEGDFGKNCYIFQLMTSQGEELSCIHFGGKNFAKPGDTFTAYCWDDMENGDNLEIVEVRERRLLYIYTPSVITFIIFIYYAIRYAGKN